MKKTQSILLIAIVFLLTGCGIQSIPRSKNDVDAKLAEVTNQYKRRADLVPNLVKVVKSYAAHEKETLTGVIEARSKATRINIDISKASPADLQKYQAAQGQLSQALGKLMMISERYPNLKADTQYRDLMAQLEGTENRITVARNRYIQSIKGFNDLVSVFPTSIANSLFFHHEKMPQWTVDASENVEKVPEVNL